MEKKLKVHGGAMQFILARRNELLIRQARALSKVRSAGGPTAGGDVYLEGLTSKIANKPHAGKGLQAGDLVGATHITKQRIEDQLGLFPEYSEMFLLCLQGDPLWEARKLWAENRKSRPSNFYTIMKKSTNLGRPSLKASDRRVKISVSVAPRTAVLLDSMRGGGSRGSVLDSLLKYESLARAVAGIAKTKTNKGNE